MITKKDVLNEIKVTVSTFQHETQSNKITDFIVWLDCRLAYIKENEKQMRYKK